MDDHTRDQKTTDALIARGLGETAAAGDCPEVDVLAAFHERTLETDETRRWTEHVADCGRCQAQLAAIGRAETDVEPATTVSTASAWWRWRVLGPLAAVSIVVLAVWAVDPNLRSMFDEPATVTEDPSLVERQVTEAARTRGAPPPAEAPVALSEATTAETPADAAPSLEAAAERRAATAAPAEPPTGAASAPAAGSPRSAAAGNSAGRPEPREALQRTAFARDATRLATVAAPGPLLLLSPDPATRWRVVQGGAVERSDDRGVTWRIQIRAMERVIDGAALSVRVAWLVGENGMVLRTTDGEEWDRVTNPATAMLTDIDAVDALDATVSTADGRRLRTVDGGANWVAVP